MAAGAGCATEHESNTSGTEPIGISSTPEMLEYSVHSRGIGVKRELRPAVLRVLPSLGACELAFSDRTKSNWTRSEPKKSSKHQDRLRRHFLLFDPADACTSGAYDRLAAAFDGKFPCADIDMASGAGTRHPLSDQERTDGVSLPGEDQSQQNDVDTLVANATNGTALNKCTPLTNLSCEQLSVNNLLVVRRFGSGLGNALLLDVVGRSEYLPVISSTVTADELWRALMCAALEYQSLQQKVLPVVLEAARTSVKDVDQLLASHPQMHARENTAFSIIASPTLVFSRQRFRLYVGNLGSALSVRGFDELGIGAVVNLSQSDNACSPNQAESALPDQVACLRIDLDDLPDAPIASYLFECCEFIAAAEERAIRSDEIRRPAALVHCQAGRSRSVTVCIAYMMLHGELSLVKAFMSVKEKRLITPNKVFQHFVGNGQADRGFLSDYRAFPIGLFLRNYAC